MNFKASLYLAAAAAALAANAAAANPLDEAKVTLGYDSYTADVGEDATGLWVGGETALDLGKFDVELGLTYGDVGGDNPVTAIKVAPKMDLGNGLTGGVFFDYAMIDDDAETDAMHYGVEGEYKTGDLAFSAFLGLGNWENDAMDEDTNVYGVAANYDFGAGLDAGAFYNAETTDDFDVTEFGFSVGYDLAKYSIPAYATASYAMVDVDGAEDTRVGFGLTIPLGANAKADKGAVKPSAHSVMAANSFLSVDD